MRRYPYMGNLRRPPLGESLSLVMRAEAIEAHSAPWLKT